MARKQTKPNTATREFPPAVLDARELADALGVSVMSVRRWTQAGLIPVVKLGRRTLRYDLEAVLASETAEQATARKCTTKGTKRHEEETL